MIDRLFELLAEYQGPGAFNQYRTRDAQLDRPDAALLRRRNLRHYLKTFATASYVLVGEAAGYAGCRFSGIPFTGEGQLVGSAPLPWVQDGKLRQTSAGEPWLERSARIVWSVLGERQDCVLWNAFPWHPFKDDPLSNRRPRARELRAAAPVLRAFLALFPAAEVYAVGRVSQGALQALDVDAPYIRHPSHGGHHLFAQAVAALPRRDLT
jgi:uracil-DNA glycosylase